MTERRVAEVYRCAHLSRGWNIVQNKPWHWPWHWPCKVNTTTSNIQNKHMYLPVLLTLRNSNGHQNKCRHGLFSSSKLCATVILDGFCQKLECHKGIFLGIILNPFIFIISIFISQQRKIMAKESARKFTKVFE